VTALWASVLLEYEITPVMDAEKGVPILAQAVAKRGG
jgi:hypothetical protein